ncbi:putative metalloprotease with PDZ domain [Luteibacter sp. Sphag1AF]|uniref:M61 family metallopeptidase n=1 Tax=Luteibacter sp. Sphag1AF TaxID=2587031 RepID=UPI001607407B|nr:M61 family metallopeptidase [Luteibacter sp. Sphag1AF]MBB3227974.1 putative metalloprotease with PDZ domain [Luteibacter sp. Sphag1AF]
MKATILASALLAAIAGIGASAAHADVPPPQDVAYNGTLKLSVDATDLNHRIFRVRETIPAAAGPLTLLFPQWIPGHHSPTGPIDQFAGLVVTANGKRIEWTRDQMNVYAFHVNVPEGATGVDVEFQTLTAQDTRQGRIVMTPEIVNVQWNQVALYPAGYNADRVQIEASLKLPEGFQFGSALEVASQSGSTVNFKPIDFDNLVDSPVFAGKYFKRVDLDPNGRSPVHLNIVADNAKSLEIKPEQLEIHRKLVQQMDKLYGARHYNHYDFLLALTEKLGGIGLEHHRSSENSASPGYFTEWDKNWMGRDLLAHEYNHSWDGKYRRGADLATPSFNVPMGDSLLWVYEGQTQFWGNVVAARSGLVTQDQARDSLAYVAATYDQGRPGLSWRNIQDTTNDPTIAQRRPLAYRNYQMSEDYYSGGQMVWLDVDTRLRELTKNKRSLDDFAKAFFGMKDGDWKVNPYTFEDVVSTLNGIAPYDWATYLRERIDGHKGPIDGIARGGWKLVYTDKPSDAVKAIEARRGFADLTYSLGVSVSSKGDIGDVRWDGPAFNAGLSPGMHVVAVNGKEFSGEALKDAVTAAKGTNVPVELLVKNFDEYKTVRIDYHDGLKYPHLERDTSKPDWLGELYKAK